VCVWTDERERTRVVRRRESPVWRRRESYGLSRPPSLSPPPQERDPHPPSLTPVILYLSSPLLILCTFNFTHTHRRVTAPLKLPDGLDVVSSDLSCIRQERIRLQKFRRLYANNYVDSMSETVGISEQLIVVQLTTTVSDSPVPSLPRVYHISVHSREQEDRSHLSEF